MFEEVFQLASALEGALRRCGANGMGLGALVEDARTRGWLRPSQLLALREFVAMRNALAHEAARAPLFERSAPRLIEQAQDALSTLEARLAEPVLELDRSVQARLSPEGVDAALERALARPVDERAAEWAKATAANVPAAVAVKVPIVPAHVDVKTARPAPQPLGWWWWAAPVVAALGVVLALLLG